VESTGRGRPWLPETQVSQRTASMFPLMMYGLSLDLVARPQSPEPGLRHRESERCCPITAQRVLRDPAASQSVVGLLLASFDGRNQDFCVSATGVVGYVAAATTATTL
jgi:hypothetical protein